MDTVTIPLPNRPVITVHKGWAPSKKHEVVGKSVPASDQRHFTTENISISSRRGISPAANRPEGDVPRFSQTISATRPRKTDQRFQFITEAAEPLRNKDAAVRKLLRSHVMKAVARERREQKKTKLKSADTKCDKATGVEDVSPHLERWMERLSGDHSELIPPVRDPSGASFQFGQKVNYNFTNFVSNFQANIHRLATLYWTQVGSAMFPMELHLAYNPPKLLLVLDMSMTDEAVFQSMHYAAAVCSTLAGGRRDSSDMIVQMSLTIGLVDRLLQKGMGIADGMLVAVCHLALGEALCGHFDDWAVHMMGLKNMIEMRGGMNKLLQYLQIKLYRADLIGSMNQVIPPLFHFDMSHRPAIYSKSHLPVYDTFLDSSVAHMELRTLLPQFVDVLTELRNFSRLREQTLHTRNARLDPKDLIEACYSIQHQLLPREPIEEVSDSDPINGNNKLGKAFRLGAIIYLREILQGFMSSGTGSRILVSKLKTSLSLVFMSETTHIPSSLLLWLLVVGGVVCVRDNMDRAFFAAHLVRLPHERGSNEWEDVKERLENVLWLGKVLDEAGEALWEEVVLAREALM